MYIRARFCVILVWNVSSLMYPVSSLIHTIFTYVLVTWYRFSIRTKYWWSLIRQYEKLFFNSFSVRRDKINRWPTARVRHRSSLLRSPLSQPYCLSFCFIFTLLSYRIICSFLSTAEFLSFYRGLTILHEGTILLFASDLKERSLAYFWVKGKMNIPSHFQPRINYNNHSHYLGVDTFCATHSIVHPAVMDIASSNHR